MRAHPRDADADRMPAKKDTDRDREPRCYKLRIHGPIGPTIMQAFPTLAATRSGQDTLLTGSLPDQSALYGVVNQLEALGLQLPKIRPSMGSRHRRRLSDRFHRPWLLRDHHAVAR
jgi:hypothetical protein